MLESLRGAQHRPERCPSVTKQWLSRGVLSVRGDLREIPRGSLGVPAGGVSLDPCVAKLSNKPMLTDLLLIAAGYLMGSVSSAIITCRLLGLPDPRSQGSGNPGATNVLRVGGRKAAAATLAGDMLKGLIPVLIARVLQADLPVQAGVAVAAFLGHLYPVFFGFRGGKGVATALGVLLGLHWPVGLATIATWLVVAYVFKISSLAALVAILLTPLYVWWLRPEPALLAAVIFMGVLLFWRHRSNIENLFKGTEERIQGPGD
jgi:glycerol-3-phosphate acyltransferase PlsY